MISGEVKQFALVNIVMTRRQTADYVAVFNKVKELVTLPFAKPVVQHIVRDFERAIWNAVKICFPDVKHFGCLFHWAQAIQKKVRKNQIH